MKSLLKYLLIFISAAAIGDGSERLGFSLTEDSLFDRFLPEEICQTNISESDSELCIPRLVNFSSAQRTLKNTRRANMSQRSNIVFIKSGKHNDSSVKYISQSRTINASSSLIDPVGKLLMIGRLII